MFKIKTLGVFFKSIIIFVLTGLVLAACNSGNPAETVAIGISPKTVELSINETKQFNSLVEGTSNTAVNWTATGGTISQNGLYIAGVTIGDFTVTVSSQADTSKSVSAIVKITKAGISINPDTATILVGGKIRFNVVGLQNNEVNWSTTGGVITQEGVFTAGNEAGDFKVVAISKADPSITAVAAVKITKKAISINISPQNAVYIKNTWRFIASVIGTNNQKVKWTVDVGSIDEDTGLYTAPDDTAIREATITATSQEDTSVTGTTKVEIRQTKIGWHKWLATDTDEYARAMAIDKDGSVYLTGYMYDADKGLFDNADHSGNSSDAFLVKYDKDGVYKWHVWLKSRAIDRGKAVAVDNAGNVYVAIETNSKVFGHENKGGFDIVLARYDKNGNKIWDTQIASDEDEYARYLTTDLAGNIYLAIVSYGEIFETANKGDSDVLVIKYAKDGTKQWHTSVSSAVQDSAISLSVDLSGNVYLGGLTKGNPKSQDLIDYDAFVTKINKSGNVVGHLWLASPKFDGNTAVVIDNKGNLFVIVETLGDLLGENQGEIDSYLIKYDSDGEKAWHRQIASNKDDRARALTVDDQGSVYVTGYSRGGLYGETAQGERDIFVVKYDAGGSKIWHHWLATDKLDYARAIVVDNTTGKVYIAGRSKGNLVGDANKGGNDAFIIEIEQYIKRK